MVFAKAAVGKATAKSVKSITRFILVLLFGFGPPFSAQTARSLFRLRSTLLSFFFSAKYIPFSADESPNLFFCRFFVECEGQVEMRLSILEILLTGINANTESNRT